MTVRKRKNKNTDETIESLPDNDKNNAQKDEAPNPIIIIEPGEQTQPPDDDADDDDDHDLWEPIQRHKKAATLSGDKNNSNNNNNNIACNDHALEEAKTPLEEWAVRGPTRIVKNLAIYRFILFSILVHVRYF